MVKDIDTASYADDSTPFIVENNIDNVVSLHLQNKFLMLCLIGSKLIVLKPMLISAMY